MYILVPELTPNLFTEHLRLHCPQRLWSNLKCAPQVIQNFISPQAPGKFNYTNQVIEVARYCPTCWVWHTEVPKHIG